MAYKTANLLAAAVAAAGFTSTSVVAQEGGAGKLEEVLVTGEAVEDFASPATPLPLSIADTPQSITVITKERIEEQNLLSVDAVLTQVTGVSMKEYDSARQYYHARGFEITNFLLDGLPTAAGLGWNVNQNKTSTVMYERVDIVRGASGLMLGTGDPSAAVNLVRKRASSSEFSGSFTAGAGEYNSYQVSGDLASGLNQSGSVRGRLVANYNEEDSFRDIGSDDFSLLYGTLEIDLAKSTLLSLGVSYQKTNADAPTWGGIPIFFSDGTRTDYDQSKTTAADWAWADAEVEDQFVELSHEFNSGWRIMASYTQGRATNDSELLYVYGAPDRDTGAGVYAWPGGKYDETYKYTTFDVNARGQFSFGGQYHDLTIGASNLDRSFDSYYYSVLSVGNIDNFNTWDSASFPENEWGDRLVYELLNETQSSIYGAVRLNPVDPLKVILGARVTDYQFDRDTASDSVDYNETVPYAGILYDITDTVTAYVSYTSIFSPQEERDANNQVLDPINGDSLEVGVKATLNNSIFVTAALFDMEQDGVAEDTGELNTTTGASIYRAVEGATAKGYELELTGMITPQWMVQLGWTDYNLEDADGNDALTTQPEKIFKSYTSYEFGGDLSGLKIGGGVNWESTSYDMYGGAVRVEQDAYYLVNLVASYAVMDDLTLRLNIDNLTDEAFYTNIGSFGQYAYGKPRKATFTVNFEF